MKRKKTLKFKLKIILNTDSATKDNFLVFILIHSTQRGEGSLIQQEASVENDFSYYPSHQVTMTRLFSTDGD